MQRLILSALAAYLAAAVSSLAQKPALEVPPQPPTLRVMSFNIRNSAAHDGANHWKFRQEVVTATVRAFDPDLLGTQEVVADQYDDLQRIFPDYTMAGVARDDGARKGEWSAILFRTARFERLGGGDFWLSETPEKVGSISWNAACVRICTWVRLRDRVTGRAFLYANTHFDHQSAPARLQSARLMSERLPLLAEGGDVIVSGDFNCTEDDDAYAALLRAPAPGGKGLADSYRAVHPERSKEEASFHAFKSTTRGSRIDWILHGPAFHALSAEIVRSPGQPPASDHFPVTTVLRWNP